MRSGAAVKARRCTLPLTGTVKVPSETRWGLSRVSAAPTAHSSYSLPAWGGRSPWIRTSKLRPALVLVTSTVPLAVPPCAATSASSVVSGRFRSRVAGTDSSTTSAAATAAASHGRRPIAASGAGIRRRRRSSSTGASAGAGSSRLLGGVPHRRQRARAQGLRQPDGWRGLCEQLGQAAQLFQLAPAVVALGQVRLEGDRLVVVELAERVPGHLDVRRGVVRHAPHAPPRPP